MRPSLSKWEQIADDLVGTPYGAGGRSLTGGMDCLGLTIEALRRGGIKVDDPLTLEPKAVLERAFADQWKPISEEAAQPGDVVSMSTAEEEQHVGVLVGRNMILHMGRGSGACIVRLDGAIRSGSVKAFYRKRSEPATQGVFRVPC